MGSNRPIRRGNRLYGVFEGFREDSFLLEDFSISWVRQGHWALPSGKKSVLVMVRPVSEIKYILPVADGH